MNKYLLLLSLTTLLCLSGCGLGDKAADDQFVLDLGQLQASCPLNTEKLAKILDEDVHKEIVCLENNLDQFVQFVRRENAQFISRQELERFVTKFFPENAEVAQDLLLLIYRLNTLLLNDPEDKISVSKLKDLFDLFYITNKEGRALASLFKNMKDGQYWIDRKLYYDRTTDLSNALLKVINKFPAQDISIDIIDFLQDLKRILKIDDDTIKTDLVEAFLFLKKLILGGEAKTITPLQLETMLEKSNEVLILGLDFLNLKDKDFQRSTDEWYFYLDIVRDFTALFYPWEKNEVILEQDHLLTIIDYVFDHKYNPENLDLSVQNIKYRFLGGDRKVWEFRDVLTLTGWGMDIFGMMYFNDISYDHFKTTLDSPTEIETIIRPEIDGYLIFPKDKIKEYWTHFEYIAKNYRYYSDDDGINVYDSIFKRNRKGFNKIALFRWLMTKVVNVYGHRPVGGYRNEVDTLDVETFMLEVKGAAEEIGLWPKDIKRFLDEAVNGSDLFQYQGDGNGLASVEELTEYVTTIFHATKIAKDVDSHMANYCPRVGADNESFEILCYRQHFIKIFFDELKLEKYFPRLARYFKFNGPQEAQQYLINLELYSREIPDASLPLTKTDMTRLIIAFSNVDAAFLRFDTDHNGLLVKSELDGAYNVFKRLIIQVGNLKGFPEPIVKSVFLYLIKEMKIPSATKLLWFHFFGKKDDITATRFNISGILSFFVTTPKEQTQVSSDDKSIDFQNIDLR